MAMGGQSRMEATNTLGSGGRAGSMERENAYLLMETNIKVGA